VNLHGPVRVADAAAAGTATISLSFDAWKDGQVAATTHSVRVLPPKPAPKPEPVAPNLVATLVHPEKKAGTAPEFSKDGNRLFVSGYPSGVVQIWDVAARRELRRFDTPPSFRNTANYALLAPDWKTLYVPVNRRAVRTIEREGKKVYRFEHSGEIRVWDVASGKQKEPLRPPAGWAPLYWSSVAPGSRFLECSEQSSYDSSETVGGVATILWDLQTGKRTKLSDSITHAQFAPDGKTAYLSESVGDPKIGTWKSHVTLVELPAGKEVARISGPTNEQVFAAWAVSPDGKVVAVCVGNVKGIPAEYWFLDARTLEVRGKLVGNTGTGRSGLAGGLFTSDSRRFVAVDSVGNAVVWDVGGQKLVRRVPTGRDEQVWFAVSADGATLAFSWMPGINPNDLADWPDPQDLPQPRVSLIDLAGNAAPRVLIAPHGYAGTVAFSPDGKTLAFGTTGAVHLFDLR
jgi:WD40 repeat protein